MLGPYLTKGSLVGVSGRLESYKTTGDVPRKVLGVDVSEVSFLARPQSEPEGFVTRATGGAAQVEESDELVAVGA